MPRTLQVCPHFPFIPQTSSRSGLSVRVINSFLGKKKSLRRRGANSDYSKLVIFSKWSSPQIHRGYQTKARGPGRRRAGQASSRHVPHGAGGAGGVGRTPCAQRSGRPSVLHRKAAKLGCFGLKTSGGDRESLKGIHFLKNSGNGEGERELLSKSFYVKIKIKKKKREK